jgi:hypothetical protein
VLELTKWKVVYEARANSELSVVEGGVHTNEFDYKGPDWKLSTCMITTRSVKDSAA